MIPVRLIAVLALAFLSTGCVAYQIRDELRTTNQRLAGIDQQLDDMSVELKHVHASVNQADPILTRSNHSLGVIEESIDPIRVSLRRIDDELHGFRQAMDKVDKYIPLNIKADTPPPAKQAPTHETTPQK